MGCVYTKSKEFETLVARNNVDTNRLELITHKYWIERGSEDLLPTDIYIQAQLGNTQYQEKGKSVRKLWKKEYSTPKIFNSMSALQEAQNEALKYFPSSALVYYKNAKGEYVLTVKQPVESVNHSAADFFEDSFPNNVGKIDLGLNSKEAYTIDKVQELYNKFNTDRRSKQLADKVFNIAKDLGLKISFNESLPFNNFGRYTNDNTITFKKSFLERDWMNDLKAPVLLHEVIHALTMYAISDQTKRWNKPEQIEHFATEINSIFQDVRENEVLKGERGVTDLKEFVAELANPIFRQKLQSIDKKNVWQRILDAIKNFLGISTESTYYNRAVNALDEALNAFDLDLYLRYNGTRNLLQQGYRAEEWNFRNMTANELRDAVKQYYYDTLPLNLEISSETKQRINDAETAAKTARSNFTYAQQNDDTGELQRNAVNERIQTFQRQYGDLVKTITPFSNKRGGMSFSVRFKTPKELIEQQNAPILKQINIIDTMSDDDLFSTFALIEQEYADYELVNGKEEKPKGKSEHTGPQPFTFKDGTVINAPFRPNTQQADALNAMDDFIHSDETSMTLSGYAGTGKTSLMEMLAKKMQKEHRNIVFSATTNKAAAVLKSRVARSGFDAYTLNKVFGISVEIDSTKAYNARNLVNVLKNSELVAPGDVVVIDEASMINEENYKILNKIAEENGLKIIYVGDKAQLAPVNESQVSKVFRNGEGTVIELTQVERTDDNAILKEATAIRNGKKLSGESSFNDKGEGVAYVTKNNRTAIGDIVRYYVQGLQNDPNYFRILAYTNDAVTKYNEAVRRTLGYSGNIPHVGEPMTGYTNWGYNYRTRNYKFINSESYKVTKVDSPRTLSINVNGQDIKMTAVPITLEDSIGNVNTFDYIDIKGNQENRQAATILAKEKARLWEVARHTVGREAKAKIYQQINAIDSFLFVNDNIIENNRFLQNKTIDFGYALTIHKSQGSTFTHVLIDDVDIQKANTMGNNAENALATVDLGEIGPDAANAELQNTEDVDLGDLSAIPEETVTPNSNIANVRQQLEYVGVSRATDTVTIISNNVKKEDSPLNHINDANKTASTSHPVAIENTPKPTEQMNKRELWEHLESLTEPMGERPVSYTPVGKTRQQYIIKDGKVYNKKGEEVHCQGKDMNRILANLAVAEDRGVVVTYRDKDYVVDNHQTITSVTSGDIMKWGPENGDRKAIIQLAEQEFRTLIENRQNRLSEMVPELMDLLKAQGINIHDRAAMAKFLKENPQWSTKIQQAIEENREMQSNKESLQALNTVDEAIKTGNWTNEASEELDNLIEQYSNGRNEITTILGRSLSETSRSSEAYAAASIILGRVHNSMRGSNDFRSAFEEFTARNKERRVKERALQQWAQNNGWWWNDYADGAFLDDYLVNEYGKGVAGSESIVHLSKNGKYVIKATSAIASEGDLIPLLQKIELHNQIFPDTSLEILGFGRTKDGNFRIITKQPTIRGKKISAKEAVTFLTTQLEAKNNQKEHSQTLFDGKVTLKDITNPKNRGNILKDAEGNYFVIDADITFSKEALKELENLNAINDTAQFMQTSEGEAYGFADQKGDLYFDEEKVSPNIQIHEYTHLWDRAVAQRNPKLWKRGVELMKQTSLWNEVLNDANYGKKWQAMKNMAPEKLESLIASEVHSRLVGTQGEALLNRIAKEKGSKGIVAKLKQWILDFWKELKGTFSNWSDEEINNLTLDDFNKMTVRDLVDKVNLKEQQNTQQPSQQQVSQQSSQNYVVTNEGIRIPMEKGTTIKLPRSLGGTTITIERIYEDPYEGTKFYGTQYDAEGNRISDITEVITFYNETNGIQVFDASGRDITHVAQQQNAINQSNNRSNNKIEYGNDFRRIQEESSRMAQGKLSEFNTGKRELTANDKQRLGGVYERLLTSRSSGRNYSWVDLSHKNNQFRVANVEGSLFHDIFEINRRYLRHGELVDLHDNYDDCKCFITSDGLCGFAIEPNGNLVSVFSLWGKDKGGFLYAISDFVKQQGATHLDAYNSKKQPLKGIYEKVFGAKVAATMDYNMEFDHDDIAANHDNPQVVFMVMGTAAEGKVEERHFNKNQYDEAQNYQQSFLQQFSMPDTSLDTFRTYGEAYTVAERDSLIQELLDEGYQRDEIRVQHIPATETEDDYYLVKVIDGSQAMADEVAQKEEVQKSLDEFEKLTQQLNNLLDSDEISASEIRHIAELVVNSISDNITMLQKEPGLAMQQFDTLKINDDFNFQTASRKEIVEAVGINRLINRAKENFDPENANYEDLDTILQADLITNNWDAIVTLAADIFAANEGFGIQKNYSLGGFDTVEGTNVDYDNFNQSQDTETVEEEEGDEQEHWQVESRTIDVLYSMSQLVRQALHECYQIDAEGNKVMSKWGIAERVNPRKAVNSILRWTQGSLTLEDMITRLTDKAKQNPWLNQLIERLSDKSGKEADFQSQFYGVFSKHFQLYSIVLLENGKYSSMPVNSHPALKEAMNTIVTQFKVGEHPLFTDKGINSKLLGSQNTTDAKAEFNLHKALSSLQAITNRLKHGETLNAEMSKEAAANLMGVCRILGYTVTEEIIDNIMNVDNIQKMTRYLGLIVRDLDVAYQTQQREAGKPNAKPYNPFEYGADNNIGGTVRNFLTPITEQLEDTAVSAFYDSGKMYQSYVTPSFMTKLMNKFKLEGQEFEDFIMKEYGNSEWFKFSGGRLNAGWRNEWLRLLATDESARKAFEHKVELNFNKHNYMRNMSDAEYTLSLITEYFSEAAQKGQSMVPAWFRIPMLSNKPSSEFIKFLSYRGHEYKSQIVNGLYKMFLQELSRIQTVRMRNHSKGDAEFISNFDSNGRKFNFLPFLNDYLDGKKGTLLRNPDSTASEDNERLSQLLKKKIDGYEALNSEEEAALTMLTEKAIRNYMEDRVQTILDEWQNNGILEAAKSIKDIGKEEETIRANIENFLWNDSFASKNILQLTITDIAFYKDAEDLQKRLAQIHAPGIRGNINATDYEGNKVTDGKYRTILIQGLQSFKTDLIANIAEVFDRKIAAAPEDQKAQLKALKESLVGEKGRYTKIDVTDGQAYSSPSSYRKKAIMFGRWSKHAEEIYQKLLKGDYNYTDLETAFQPLKPFVYTHLQKDMGVDNAPIHQIPVPFQAKNSEYLLIMADALLQGEQTSRPNLLRAIYRVMEDSERLNPTKGIDTVQFDSAIKSGLQAPIDLNPFVNMVGGEEAAFEYMKKVIYKLDDQGNPSNEYNTNTYVHEGLYEDYCLQQEVPEHFRNHSQAHGSQIRMIIPSDLDLYKNPSGNKEDENNKVYYEWTEPDGTHKKMNAMEFRREYEKTIAENIAQSIAELETELHINSDSKKERNIALSKILQREILSSPRYGVDLIQACSVDKETGEFRIPKGDPIQAKRIEQLINSIIKNRVNKQKIAGGPIVQVTNFGASRQLHIRFYDKNGGILMTREEYEQNPQKKELSQTDKFNARYGKKSATGNMTYEEYVKNNQAGIAYFEVFIPIWSKELFEKFSNEDGTINMEAIENTDPELLKMISYRIPTEEKYSCAPMKVVGFMPREAGSAIMLPYELTEIDDSDFDVDKRYVMRKDIPIKKKPSHIIRKELFKVVEESYKKQHNNQNLPNNIANEIEVFLDSPDTMRDKSQFTKWLYSQYQKVAYTTEPPTSGKIYRDNKIIDMTWAVLTNEMTADKILNPGGFNNFKRSAYMIAAYKNGSYSWEQLQNLSIDELKSISSVAKDLTWADTQIHFYHQNAAGSNLIGVFAVNKVAHATLEGNDILIDVNEICGEQPFTIANTTFDGRMQVDPMYDKNGNLVGKTIGSGVSASADTAKEPTLDLLNINMTTAGIFNTMLRLGMAFEDAALFMSQDAVGKILEEFNRKNLTNYEPLSNIIEARLAELQEKYDIDEHSNINTEPLSVEELIDGLKETSVSEERKDVIDYKVLLAFQKLRSLADAIRKPTFATRFNSVSSAVGPLIIDNLILEHKMEQFTTTNDPEEAGTHFYTTDGNFIDIEDIFADHPILRQFARTVDVARQMFKDMPAGSTGFRELLSALPDGLVETFYNDKKLLDQLSNFYQSYLLLASGFIEESQLKNYVDGFPKWFMKQNLKEKYPENALIQAIKMGVNKKTNRPYLYINITGEDTQAKEELGNAWVDLHKADPELSQRLFTYNFFRAGIGFSPKTFMALVNTYVKERLNREVDGRKISYVNTYRNFPNVVPIMVIDQFIRNNWDNNKLVPKKGGEGTKYLVDLNRGTLVVRDPKDMADLEGVAYMKTRNNGKTYLWKQIAADKYAMNYVLVKPLGSNGEYLEMSLSDIKKPLSETTQTVEDMNTTEIKEDAPVETDVKENTATSLISESEQAKNLAWFADGIQKQRESINKPVNRTEAENMVEKMKRNPEMFGDYMVRVFSQLGVQVNKEEAIESFKKLC